MSRFKAAILTITLGVVLATAMPTPARADIDITGFLSTMFQGLMTGINKLLGVTEASGQTAAAATAATGQALADTNIKISDANNQATDQGNKNLAGTQVALHTEDPSDFSCQIAANAKDEYARKAAETKLMQRFAWVLEHLYINPQSGKRIGKNQISKALCALGAVGKDKAGCQTEASDPKRSSIEGGDWSVTNALILNECIPFDLTKINTELKKIADLGPNDTYTLGNEDMREAMVAFLSIRVNRKFSISSIPGGVETDTADGRDNADSLREKVSQVLGSAQPLLQMFAWNACFSTAMLPSCKTDNKDLIDTLVSAKADDMPDGNYCISQTQKNDGQILLYMDGLTKVGGEIPGTKIETSNLSLQLNKAIEENKKRYVEVKEAASKAAAERPEDTTIGQSARPTSENEIRDLKDSIRKLTRAIEQTNAKLPRTQNVHLSAPDKNADAGALPPLRQDFPVVP